MSNSYVQVPPDSTGKKMQTFENTVGGNTVESEAVTLVKSSDNSEIGTASQPVRVDPTGTTTQPVSFTSSSATGSSAPSTAVEEGLVANVGSSLPTAVTNGQLVGAMGDKFGRQVVLQNAHRSVLGTASVQNTGGSGTLIAAGATGVYTDIITLILTNENASTATVVSVSDGTTTYKFALAAAGGGVFQFPTPLPAASSATAWTISNSGSVNVDAVVVYVNNK